MGLNLSKPYKAQLGADRELLHCLYVFESGWIQDHGLYSFFFEAKTCHEMPVMLFVGSGSESFGWMFLMAPWPGDRCHQCHQMCLNLTEIQGIYST